jgi:hypothetical protein
MKKLILIFFTATIMVTACKKGSSDPQVNNSLANTPFKIVLTTDKNTSPSQNTMDIVATDSDEVHFSVKVTNKDGVILNNTPVLTLNGNLFDGTTFKTLTPGNYVFQASVNELASNKFTVTARDVARKYVKIDSSSIKSISMYGSVGISVTFKNISSKPLKYASFDVQCFDSGGAPIREKVLSTYTVTGRVEGIYEPNTTYHTSFGAGTFTGAKTTKVTLSSVTLEDGTVINNN